MYAVDVGALDELVTVAGSQGRDLRARQRGVMLAVLLGLKPLVDLFWWVDFSEVLGQRLNAPTVYALGLGAVGALVLPYTYTRIPRWLLPFAAVSTLSTVGWLAVSGVGDLVRLWTLVLVASVAAVGLADLRLMAVFMRVHVATVLLLSLVLVGQIAGQVEYQYFDYLGGSMSGRPSGGLPQPLGYIFVGIPAIAFAAVFARSPELVPTAAGRRVAQFLAYWLTATCVLTTHRFGGFVALAVLASFELARVRGLAGRIERRHVLRFGIVVSTGAIVLWPRIVRSLRVVFDSNGNFSLEGFTRGRLDIWRWYLHDYADGGSIVWLFGRGTPVRGVSGVVLDEPHNDFLRILVTSGAIALTLYMAFLVAVWRAASTARANPAGGSNSWVARVVCILVVSLMALSLYTEPSRFPSGLWTLMVLASTMARARKVGPQRSRDSNMARGCRRGGAAESLKVPSGTAERQVRC